MACEDSEWGGNLGHKVDVCWKCCNSSWNHLTPDSAWFLLSVLLPGVHVVLFLCLVDRALGKGSVSDCFRVIVAYADTSGEKWWKKTWRAVWVGFGSGLVWFRVRDKALTGCVTVWAISRWVTNYLPKCGVNTHISYLMVTVGQELRSGFPGPLLQGLSWGYN